MAYEMKEGSASLFKNSRKTSDNHPDYTGSIMLQGKEHYLSAWIKESAKVGKYFSISVGKIKEPVGFKAAGSDELPRNTIVDDDVPF
jgi:uncharacterized protein (DUF736 family)